LDEDRPDGGKRRSPTRVAVKQASEMTDEELEARIEELDARIRPMLEMKPVEVYST
jgi:hypothetical protein